MKIIFMGTPEFAVPSLKKLIENYQVVAVITAPDKPRGRGQKLCQSPIKLLAIESKIPVLQPEDLKNEEFIENLKTYKADLQIVVAFRMLPNVVWQMPPLGTVNLHGSLLPNYRGAAPINWAVINGETETGLTTFFIEEKMDTGNIIFQETQPIFPKDTAGSLHDRMMMQGAGLILKTVQAIESGDCIIKQQVVEKNIKPAPKIHNEDCEINTNHSADYIINFVRGLAPKPGAHMLIEGVSYKIFDLSKTISIDTKLLPGEIATDNETYLAFGTSSETLAINLLQQSGKKTMPIKAFLQGNKFSEKFLKI